MAVARGYWLTFFSDWICGALILSVVLAFSWNAKFAAGRVRLFWILEASSWALLLVNQGIWMFFDLILKKDVPGLFAGDALLFVSGVPSLAGLLLQPHIAPSKAKNRLGTVDFLLLLVWWVYLYLFFVIPCVSFGFKHGVPEDSDLMFDVRFLPNPHFVPEFRALTGRDPRVAKYIRSFPQTQEFISRISQLLIYLLPHYIHEGKSYLTISFGCTGGQHRSVMIAEDVSKLLRKAGYRVKVTHRDSPT